jgi:flagellar basal-body rod protein FlgG
MNQGIYSLAASMVNQLNRVDLLSNNIANTNTTAFKQDNLVEGSFNYYLDKNDKNQEIKKRDENSLFLHKLNSVTNTVPKIDGNYFTKTQGSIIQTNNQLDFSIKQNDVFFKVRNDNNDILLSKDGAFKNLDGFLVTSEGYKVLNIDNENIAVEDGFEAQISLIKTPYTNLDKFANNNYKMKDTTNIEVVANNEKILLQGSLEKSNINAIKSMVGLIDAQRRLEQAQKASVGISEINQKLIDKLTR